MGTDSFDYDYHLLIHTIPHSFYLFCSITDYDSIRYVDAIDAYFLIPDDRCYRFPDSFHIPFPTYDSIVDSLHLFCSTFSDPLLHSILINIPLLLFNRGRLHSQWLIVQWCLRWPYLLHYLPFVRLLPLGTITDSHRYWAYYRYILRPLHIYHLRFAISRYVRIRWVFFMPITTTTFYTFSISVRCLPHVRRSPYYWVRSPRSHVLFHVLHSLTCTCPALASIRPWLFLPGQPALPHCVASYSCIAEIHHSIHSFWYRWLPLRLPCCWFIVVLHSFLLYIVVLHIRWGAFAIHSDSIRILPLLGAHRTFDSAFPPFFRLRLRRCLHIHRSASIILHSTFDSTITFYICYHYILMPLLFYYHSILRPIHHDSFTDCSPFIHTITFIPFTHIPWLHFRSIATGWNFLLHAFTPLPIWILLYILNLFYCVTFYYTIYRYWFPLPHRSPTFVSPGYVPISPFVSTTLHRHCTWPVTTIVHHHTTCAIPQVHSHSYTTTTTFHHDSHRLFVTFIPLPAYHSLFIPFYRFLRFITFPDFIPITFLPTFYLPLRIFIPVMKKMKAGGDNPHCSDIVVGLTDCWFCWRATCFHSLLQVIPTTFHFDFYSSGACSWPLFYHSTHCCWGIDSPYVDFVRFTFWRCSSYYRFSPPHSLPPHLHTDVTTVHSADSFDCRFFIRCSIRCDFIPLHSILLRFILPDHSGGSLRSFTGSPFCTALFCVVLGCSLRGLPLPFSLPFGSHVVRRWVYCLVLLRSTVRLHCLTEGHTATTVPTTAIPTDSILRWVPRCSTLHCVGGLPFLHTWWLLHHGAHSILIYSVTIRYHSIHSIHSFTFYPFITFGLFILLHLPDIPTDYRLPFYRFI